jgi:hypothetical protein
MLMILRKKERNNNNSKPQQKSNRRLQQVVDYQPGDRLKEGTQIFIPLSVQKKGFKKSESPQINEDNLPLSVLMFFTEIFHLLVEQTNIYYQQYFD